MFVGRQDVEFSERKGIRTAKDAGMRPADEGDNDDEEGSAISRKTATATTTTTSYLVTTRLSKYNSWLRAGR